MTLPLLVLAFLSAVGGWVGLPAVFSESGNRFASFLAPIFLPLAGGEPSEQAAAHANEWLLMAASLAIALGGIFLAWKWYWKEKGRVPTRLAASYPAAYAFLADKFRVDEFYDFLFVRPFNALARVLWKVVDVLVIDGILNAGAFLVELTGDLLRFLQTGNVRNYVLTFFLGIVALLLLVIGAR